MADQNGPFSPDALKSASAGIDLKPDPAQQPAKKPNFRKVGLPVFAGGQLADLITTLNALSNGAQEQNPILSSNPIQNGLIKGGSDVGIGLLLDYLAQHGHNKLANALGILGGGAGAAAAIHNVRVK